MSDSRVTAFENLMGWANSLAADNNRRGLEDLIKIVLRPVQAIQIRDALLRPRHCGPQALHWMSSFGKLWEGDAGEGTWAAFMLKHCRRAVEPNTSVRLASDMVIPTLWSESSILNSLGMIGKGRELGEFVQETNHSLTLMQPLNIGWVNGGNHSIAQGILSGEGELIPDDVYDVTEIIKGVSFDGEFWFCRRTGEKLGSPIYAEFGWAWEIARFLIDLPRESTG
ncbi:hypothetical protein FYM84_11155 [Pseudomonas sp. CAH-1]|nr:MULTISPECIES: DUF6710 family protein [Pseudomonas]MBH3372270.1 hypothetical protein [Pseudomonas juntendi]MBS6036821.1 hypothetical protein [Pseudomonas sp.]MRT61189.1 hypothetical protein [Pseudomonas sp. CAH-1]